MGRRDAFDAFCRALRPSILHQTYAFVGDPDTAQHATSDAFVQAAHHWRKLRHDPQAEAWLRVRAFRASGSVRNRPTRPWYVRAAEIDDATRPLILALQGLSPSERTLVVLRHLVGIELAPAGREAGVTDQDARELLAKAEQAVAAQTGIGTPQLGPALAGLRRDLVDIPVDRPAALRREGARRRRSHVLLVGLSSLATLIAAGALTASESNRDTVVTAPGGDGPADIPLTVPSVRVSQLVPLRRVARLLPGARLDVRSTSWDKQANSRYDACLDFARSDRHAVHFWLRSFAVHRPAPGRVLQTLQVSLGASAARSAYLRTVRAYAICQAPRRQLVDYATVSATGDRAALVQLRYARAKEARLHSVVIAQSGRVVTSFVADTPESQRVPARHLVTLLRRGVDDICVGPHGSCTVGPARAVRGRPPSASRERGFLSAVDLPLFPTLHAHWIATAPRSTQSNPAATGCDQADFAGSSPLLTRTYVVSGSGAAPTTFGLTETIGTFGGRRRAAAYLARIKANVDRCHKRQLSLGVPSEATLSRAADGAAGYVWIVAARLNATTTQKFWTSLIQVRDRVVQVTFTPAGGYDVDSQQFTDLVRRAAKRVKAVRG